MQRRTFLTAVAAGLVPPAVFAHDWLLPQPYTPPAPRYPGRHTAWTIECRCTVFTGATVHVYHQGQPVVGYPAMAPDVDDVTGGVMVGRVTGVEMPPSWAPTPNMRARNPGLRAYAPGERGNPMGQVAKLMIAGFGYRRLHGYSDPRLGNTAGCVALDDAHLRDLVGRLGGARSFQSTLRQSGTVIFYVT